MDRKSRFRQLHRTLGFNPLTLNPVGWWEARSVSTVGNGNPIISLPDKSVSGITLNSDTTYFPSYNVAGAIHWLNFDGSDAVYAQNAALNLVGDMTAVVAAYKNGYGVQGTILGTSTGDLIKAFEMRFSNNAAATELVFNHAHATIAQSTTHNTTGVSGAWEVLSVRRSIGVSVETSRNKARRVDAGMTLVPTTDGASNFYLGMDGGYTVPLTGRIAGAIIFNNRLSDANLALVETYIGSLVGLSL